MNKVLVAGATGYLGGHVVEALLARKQATRALARRPERVEVTDEALLEVVRAEVTRPDTLEGLLDGVDTVISTVGITRQRDGLTYEQVDYQANLNLLEAAQAAGVRRFIYVSVLDGEALRHLEICKAKERFVDALKASGLEYVVIRPNGFFSDMASFVDMARRGRVYLFGDGSCRSNPIHGVDLAQVCVDAIDGPTGELEVGGPDTFTQVQIAELALAAVGKPPSITKIPDAFRRVALSVLRCVTPVTVYGPLEFFMTVLARDMIAPETGSNRLGDFFQLLAHEPGPGSQ